MTSDSAARAFLVDLPAIEEPRYIKRDGRLYANERADSAETRATLASIAHKNQELMFRLAGRLEPQVEAFLRSQGERVIAEATNGRASGEAFEVRAIEQYDWLADDEELRALMNQWWAVVTEEAFGAAATLFSIDFEFSGTNPFLAEIEGLLGHRIRGINESTRQRVEAIVLEQLGQGTSIPELKAALEEWIEPLYKSRAQTIARTESQVALNTATEKAYAATGQVTNVRGLDGTECDAPAGSDGLTCPERNGLVIPLADIQRHIQAEHPNGTFAYAPILDPIEGVDF